MNALLVDIGNTRIKWRFDDTRLPIASAHDGGAVPLDRAASLAEAWRTTPPSYRVDTVVVSAVASEAVAAAVETSIVERWPTARSERIVASAARGGVVNGYRLPSQLGPDRWLALIGARATCPARSLLVCSFGTATTIDLLVSDGDAASFAGGMILPGLDAMRRALVRDTARLPDSRGRVVDFADNTDDAIETGLVTAQVGAVERALRAARDRIGSDPGCIVAGGAAPAVTPALTAHGVAHRLVADVVLRGLAMVARETAHRPAPTAVD